MEPEIGGTKSHSLDSSGGREYGSGARQDYAMMIMMMMMTYLFVHVINIF